MGDIKGLESVHSSPHFRAKLQMMRKHSGGELCVFHICWRVCVCPGMWQCGSGKEVENGAASLSCCDGITVHQRRLHFLCILFVSHGHI